MRLPRGCPIHPPRELLAKGLADVVRGGALQPGEGVGSARRAFAQVNGDGLIEVSRDAESSSGRSPTLKMASADPTGCEVSALAVGARSPDVKPPPVGSAPAGGGWRPSAVSGQRANGPPRRAYHSFRVVTEYVLEPFVVMPDVEPLRWWTRPQRSSYPSCSLVSIIRSARPSRV